LCLVDAQANPGSSSLQAQVLPLQEKLFTIDMETEDEICASKGIEALPEISEFSLQYRQSLTPTIIFLKIFILINNQEKEKISQPNFTN
jgi:hypothetical protein